MEYPNNIGNAVSTDSANAKRKLDIHSTPMTVMSMDSQSKVRRRGTSLSSNDSAIMKRSLSDGTIACLDYEQSDNESENRYNTAMSCPISPSSDTMGETTATPSSFGSTMPRHQTVDSTVRPSAAFSPFHNSPGTADVTSPRPVFFAASPTARACRTSAPSSPHPLAAAPMNISQNFGESLKVSNGTTMPALGRSSTGPRRGPWQAHGSGNRKSRNPGNLSLDLSQMDQLSSTAFVPVDSKCGFRRNDHAAVCSQVTDFLYVGGAVAAKDLANLQELGITHIINCAASVAPAFYPNAFQYYNIRLRDHTSQDISRYFYNVFDFIEKARCRNGKVFVHCMKGISRSPTMAIAYLMWSKRIDVNKALEFVRQARPVVDPNSGFIFQLTEWEHLRSEGKLRVERPMVFRIELPQGDSHGNGNGARAAEKPLIVGPLLTVSEADFTNPSEEMASSCCIVSYAEFLCIWCGGNVTEVDVEAAQHAVSLLQAYESFPEKYELVTSGQESPALWRVLEALQPQVAL